MKMCLKFFQNIFFFVIVAVVRFGPVSSSLHSHERRLFDLTHPYNDHMPTKEKIYPFDRNSASQIDEYGVRSESFDFCTVEKLGTHLNAPITYNQDNQSHSVDKIPLKHLLNIPGVVVDLPATEDEDDFSATLTIEHLTKWEQEHGIIPHGAFVILRTGWSKFYRFPDKFFGNFVEYDKPMFPGFSADSVQWLLNERGAAGLGTECSDVELPWKTQQQVKKILAEANSYSVVQLTHVKLLPPRGFDVTVAPMKMTGGTGGPTRVFAALHNINNVQLQHHTPEPQFQTSTKVRRVEPRAEPTPIQDLARSETVETSTEFSRMLVSSEEYSNDSAKLSMSFYCLSIFVAMSSFL